MSEVFDLNDPRLNDLPVEDFDPDGSMIQIPPAPPSDGIHTVHLTLRTGGQSDPIYVKSDDKGTRIVARFSPRFVKEDGGLGGFLKDFFASSSVPTGQSTSSLAVLCRVAGYPTKRFANLGEYADHVKAAFDSQEGFQARAKTRWVRSVPFENEQGGTSYTEIQGEAAVRAFNLEEVVRYRAERTLDEKTLELLEANPHLYYDAKNAEVKSVQAQIRNIEE